jgi:elongation factor G
MKRYPTEKLRNLGIIAHGGAGKTSIAEAMLFDSGVVDRLGRTDDGNATLDYDPEEIRRKISISLGLAPFEWKGTKINILDTPGYFDFVGEVKAALRVVDGVLLVTDAVAGVEVGTALVWGYADDAHLARMAFVNKMDRDNADFFKVLSALQTSFGEKVIPIQIPIGAEAGFKGVVDLVSMKALVHPDGAGNRVEEKPVPADLQSQAEDLRNAVIEAAAENDDDLLMKYLEGEDLTEDEIRKGLRAGVVAGKVCPVLCGSATKNTGMQALLDAVVAYMPSPADTGGVTGQNPKTQQEVTRRPLEIEPFCALVFKTTADPYVGKLTVFRVYSGVIRSDSSTYNINKTRNERIGQLFTLRGKQQEPTQEIWCGDIGAVAKLAETQTGDTLCEEPNPLVLEAMKFPAPVYSVAVVPKSKGDEDKIGAGITRLTEEDPTIKVERNPETFQTILSGMGDLHLDVITERLRRKFGVDVTLKEPRIAYRETVKGSSDVEGRHKKQTGGRGQYGHVYIKFDSLPTGSGFEFADKVFGGSVPRQYIPAVEKGLREAIQEGVLAGYPATDIRATLYDGSFHPVDSSEMAFKIAALLAFKKGCMEARPVLLEPIMSVEITVPDQYMGDVMGDLNKKRGRILGMEPKGPNQIIRALVPASGMLKYAIDLRSMTQGRGVYTMQFDHYEEVPANESEKIVEEAKKAKEAENK